VQEGRWDPGPVVENLVLTGTRSPDRPTTRSDSLYRLRCPGPWKLRQWEEYRTEGLEWNCALVDYSSVAAFKYFSARAAHENLLDDFEFRDYWRSESQTFLREIEFCINFLTFFSDLCEILYIISILGTVWHLEFRWYRCWEGGTFLLGVNDVSCLSWKCITFSNLKNASVSPCSPIAHSTAQQVQYCS
jgi:hypothetical protein